MNLTRRDILKSLCTTAAVATAPSVLASIAKDDGELAYACSPYTSRLLAYTLWCINRIEIARNAKFDPDKDEITIELPYDVDYAEFRSFFLADWFPQGDKGRFKTRSLTFAQEDSWHNKLRVGLWRSQLGTTYADVDVNPEKV